MPDTEVGGCERLGTRRADAPEDGSGPSALDLDRAVRDQHFVRAEELCCLRVEDQLPSAGRVRVQLRVRDRDARSSGAVRDPAYELDARKIGSDLVESRAHLRARVGPAEEVTDDHERLPVAVRAAEPTISRRSMSSDSSSGRLAGWNSPRTGGPPGRRTHLQWRSRRESGEACPRDHFARSASVRKVTAPDSCRIRPEPSGPVHL